MKIFIKVIAAAAAIALLICGLTNILPASEIASEVSFDKLAVENGWNGELRDQLSEGEKYVYDMIADAIYASKISVHIPMSGYDDTSLRKVIDSVYYDHPELFWLDYSGIAMNINNSGITISLTYYAAGDELSEMKNAFTAALNILTSSISGETDEWLRALKIHDRIAEKCAYDSDYSDTMIHTAYGALVDGSAVCDGYAKAYKCAMDTLGISCRIVPGSAVITGAEEEEPHAWNIIKIGGVWTTVDLTWNEIEFENNTSQSIDTVAHAYFCVSGEDIAANHIMSATSIAAMNLPELQGITWYDRFGFRSEDGADIIDPLANKLVENLSGTDSFFELRLKDNEWFFSEGYIQVIEKANEALESSGSEFLFDTEGYQRYFTLSSAMGCYMFICSTVPVEQEAAE